MSRMPKAVGQGTLSAIGSLGPQAQGEMGTAALTHLVPNPYTESKIEGR